jgi:hypothetical protein
MQKGKLGGSILDMLVDIFREILPREKQEEKVYRFMRGHS